MSRSSQILAFSVPPTVVKEVETLAKQERRTKSELFREMVRVYGRYRIQREREELGWIEKMVAETKAEEVQNPTSPRVLLKQSEKLARAGEQQAKKLGLKTDTKSINRIVHERRKARRA